MAVEAVVTSPNGKREEHYEVARSASELGDDVKLSGLSGNSFLTWNIIIIFKIHIWSKILCNKNLSDFVETFTYFNHITYLKNVKVWIKINKFLLNKFFASILKLFLV